MLRSSFPTTERWGCNMVLIKASEVGWVRTVSIHAVERSGCGINEKTGQPCWKTACQCAQKVRLAMERRQSTRKGGCPSQFAPLLTSQGYLGIEEVLFTYCPPPIAALTIPQSG